MTTAYRLPPALSAVEAKPQTAWLVASGDLRASANIAGWPAQEELERQIGELLGQHGWRVSRAHSYDPKRQHGFIDSQRRGLDVFSTIPPEAPLIVAEAVWQYSHHVLAGLRSHRGPILTIANFDGQWPGLVGLLGLNACLTKMSVPYSTAWSIDFTDAWVASIVGEWLATGMIVHDVSHVHPLAELPDTPEVELGKAIAADLLTRKAIIGVFDEGCMGMYNAIIDDELLNPIGIYKERLSQSALYAEMLTVDSSESGAALTWLEEQGMRFRWGTDDATELTREQVLDQLAMYIAALRIADDFGVDALGIQYQQGLKDLTPASDLAEGLLNNVSRPPVFSRDGSRVLWASQALPHFNEADEGVAVDALVTNRVWTAMGMDPATTLHDVRWGEQFEEEFVWVFEISGSVPPSHFAREYRDAEGWRQSPVYFPRGGSTIRGVSKPGEIVWSRVFVSDGELCADIGRARAVELPSQETERRWAATNPEWPIMHVVLPGIDRNQFMARHKANHIQVAYASDADAADRALLAKAAVFSELGLRVFVCGRTAMTAED